MAAAAAAAGPADFNGRWDVSLTDKNRSRGWWLEIRNAESGKPAGSWIGAPGGGLDAIAEAKVQGGELSWTIVKKPREGKEWRGVYRAKLVGGKLEGTLDTGTGQPTAWVGVRAPQFKRIDPKTLKPGQPVELFNGRDLSGWKPLHANREMAWEVVDGITRNKAGATDLVTEQKFWNFKLHAEYRIGPGSNSGIGLRGRYEVQIYEDHGKPVSLHGNGALYSRILPTSNATKPAGEWQVFDITLVENRVTVVVNGTTVIDDKEVDGITAIAMESNEGEPGPIIIQGDHGVVEFRKLTLTPLT